MKYIFPTILAAMLINVVMAAPMAFAEIPPTMHLTATGTGDDVEVAITGAPNQSVLLSYTQTGSGPTIVALGTTNGTGAFTRTISSASYGLVGGTLVTALIGGTGGLKSPTLSWPSVVAASSFTLNQNAVVLSVGGSTTLTASGAGSSSLYVSNNSNPAIANVNISGTQVTLSGNVAGSTVVTVCQVGTTTSCPTISVVVQAAGAGPLSFSQSNVTVVKGQNLPITISGGNGAYTIRNNTSAATIQASVSGAVLTLSTGATAGSSSVTVCSTDGAACGVVVAMAGDASSVATTLSNTAPTVRMNESVTVQVYGPSGVQFYVSNNSNPSTVQANLSGTTLTLTGIAAGTSAVSVCASTNSCASLTVTVQNAIASGPISLSQNTLSVAVNQSGTVTVTGGTQPYTLVGGTSSVSRQSVSGNTVTVYGIAAGSSRVQVCSAEGGCILLVVTVQGGSTTTSLFDRSTLSLAVGESAEVPLSGAASYYLSGNSNASIASASVSGSATYVRGLSVGTTNLTVCASGGACSTLPATVTVATAQPSPVVTTPAYVFTEYLSRGKEDAEVLALQKLLAALGLLAATPNGYYGPQTTAAVVAFQRAHNIDPLGVVGPSTRAALNSVSLANSTASSGTIQTMSLTELRAEVLRLQAQLAAALNRIASLQGH